MLGASVSVGFRHDSAVVHHLTRLVYLLLCWRGMQFLEAGAVTVVSIVTSLQPV
jgi:hypothetical protein